MESEEWCSALQVPPAEMVVAVTIGVQRPERVDLDRVKASLPYGQVTARAVKGGLDIPDPAKDDPAVVASAAIVVSLPL